MWGVVHRSALRRSRFQARIVGMIALHRAPARLSRHDFHPVASLRPQTLSERVSVFTRNWNEGRRFGIPLCCRAHFCLDRALGRVVSVVRWRQIGTWNTALLSDDPWVPCGGIHGGYSPFSAPRRLVRIFAFNLVLRLPGRRASRMRERTHECGPVWTSLPAGETARISRAGGNGQLWWAQRLARHP
jgi:hypothetical protein